VSGGSVPLKVVVGSSGSGEIAAGVTNHVNNTSAIYINVRDVIMVYPANIGAVEQVVLALTGGV
jgi:hypothetical protein